MPNPHETWYICNQPFISADPDFEFSGRKGITRVRGDDPAYKRFKQFFVPMSTSDKTAPEVEAAVAGPGQKRGA